MTSDELQDRNTSIPDGLGPQRVHGSDSAVAHWLVECGRALGACAATVFSVSRDELTLRAAWGYPQFLCEQFQILPINAPYPLAETVRSESAIWLGSPSQWNARYPQMLVSHGHRRAWATLPIRDDGRVVGALGLSWAEPQEFTEDFRVRAQMAADDGARVLTAVASPLTFLQGGGEMGALIRSIDWSTTAAGPADSWPQSLRTVLSILLSSEHPIFVWWGPELVQFYNDGYRPILGSTKHPAAMGQRARECWSEIWDIIEPMIAKVLAGGSTYTHDGLLPLERHGFAEECYFDYAYSPIRDESSGVAGVFVACSETTARVLSERRLALLGAVSIAGNAAKDRLHACRELASILDGACADVPFSLFYLRSERSSSFRLLASHGVEPAFASEAEPELFRFFDDASKHDTEIDLGELSPGWQQIVARPWPDFARRALVLPLGASAADGTPRGFLVAGLSPRLVADERYRQFLHLLGGHIATALANIDEREHERHRARELAAIDRAKTAFFNNVSHEFRTPLTLMLGPLDELRAVTSNEDARRDDLDILYRNTQRLSKLVNSLLDFSRVEASRVEPSYQAADLSALTAGLARTFQHATDRAGLGLLIDCPPLDEPVFVDVSMWEKIVLNLLSNAFKFTFEGSIGVRVALSGSTAELTVFDTGIGIAPENLPRLFERFHRVEGARSRSHEGTGIGLALVHELVQMHTGEVDAQSEVGKGTTFTVRVPRGASHVPSDRVRREPDPAFVVSQAYAEEALRWLTPSRSSRPPPPELANEREGSSRPLILFADDNADMRSYVSRLLSDRWGVEAVEDGEAALAAVRRKQPDLVLADVMMPRLDGISLLRALRADPATSAIPVVLLSARAGEEAAHESLGDGADDYIVKPFDARDLIVRVAARLASSGATRELRRAQEELQETHQHVRLATEASGVGIWQWNVVTNHICWDAQMFAIYGVAPTSDGVVPYTAWSTAVLPEHLAEQEAALQATVRARGRGEREFRIRRANDGALRDIEAVEVVRTDARGEAQWVIGTNLDVTERTRAEVSLRESEQRLRMALEASSTGLWLWDVRTNGVTWSPECYAIFQVPKESFAGTADAFFGLVHEDDLALVESAVRAAIDANTLYECEFRVVRPNGEAVWVANRGRANYDDDGQALEMLGTVTDISFRKATEESLKLADRRKDEFLATLAHELRNPLAPIRTGLAILASPSAAERGSIDTPQVLGMMERQLGHLVNLVDDLLDLSRIRTGKIALRNERLTAAEVIEAAFEACRAALDAKEQALSVELPPSPLRLIGDRTRLVQVLCNLLMNAAKYSDRGSNIRIVAALDGGSIVIRVIDKGIGIAPELMASIWDLFTQVRDTLDKAQGGLGIGLSLVKKLVELHGGTVSAESAGIGCGSAFSVTLPAADGDVEAAPCAEAVRRPTESPVESHAHALRVLIVDDNVDGAEMLAMLLSALGYETSLAHDGSSAIKAFSTFRPDMMVLDIGLPDIDGYEVCRRLRAEADAENTVVVAMTGWGGPDDKQKATTAGFDLHLTKPVDMGSLKQLVSTLAHCSQPKARRSMAASFRS
jgi:PAS domain S-box-containing protein